MYTSGIVRTVLLCWFVATLHAQQGGEGLLAEVRAKVVDSVGRLSNYMCTETVERMVYALPAAGPTAESCAGLLAAKGHGRLLSSDRIRLDVGASRSSEMYSWAGENRFDARTPWEIVERGTTSNGSFTALLSMIFMSDPVKFSYVGDIREAEHPLVEFAFDAPLEKSHYFFSRFFRVGAAYAGTFLVDPKTADLVRLTIRTKGLPAESGACEVATTTDYQNMHLNHSTFLLPSVVGLVIVDTDGNENVNQTVFSPCREFQGESTVNFGDARKVLSSKSPMAPGELAVRRGLPFEVALTQDIDTSKAAAGDAFRCELTTPIRDGRKLVAPVGTPVTARIVELRRTYGSLPSVSLGFRLESLYLEGAVRTFVAHAKGMSRRPASVREVQADDDRQLTLVFADPKGNMLNSNGLKTIWMTGL